ncbi:hypothetical protein PCARR_a0088 [Pseudoalteromonas carrageenovora IAM 12662]|uniref:Uncharacterized protein n=1 Tax=Pseudoalteromonas carrageenovora IAM 12662 TaxID=1314868 RepID=A0ABR9ENL0_PSEVC|nr:hypothetical protein [Pseudoalteromonas carrageenovora IAM 12662]
MPLYLAAFFYTTLISIKDAKKSSSDMANLSVLSIIQPLS